MKPAILLQLVFFIVGLGLSPSVAASDLDPIPAGATNSALFPGSDYCKKLHQAEIQEKLNEEKQRREKRLEVQRSLPQFIKDANAEHLASTPITATPDPATTSPVSLLQILQTAVVLLLIVGLGVRRFIRRLTDSSNAYLKTGPLRSAAAPVLVAVDFKEEESVSEFTVALLNGLPAAESWSRPSPLTVRARKPPTKQAQTITTHHPVYYKRSLPKRDDSSPKCGKLLEGSASDPAGVQQKTFGEQASLKVAVMEETSVPQLCPACQTSRTEEDLARQTTGS